MRYRVTDLSTGEFTYCTTGVELDMLLDVEVAPYRNDERTWQLMLPLKKQVQQNLIKQKEPLITNDIQKRRSRTGHGGGPRGWHWLLEKSQGFHDWHGDEGSRGPYLRDGLARWPHAPQAIPPKLLGADTRRKSRDSKMISDSQKSRTGASTFACNVVPLLHTQEGLGSSPSVPIPFPSVDVSTNSRVINGVRTVAEHPAPLRRHRSAALLTPLRRDFQASISHAIALALLLLCWPAAAHDLHSIRTSPDHATELKITGKGCMVITSAETDAVLYVYLGKPQTFNLDGKIVHQQGYFYVREQWPEGGALMSHGFKTDPSNACLKEWRARHPEAVAKEAEDQKRWKDEIKQWEARP